MFPTPAAVEEPQIDAGIARPCGMGSARLCEDAQATTGSVFCLASGWSVGSKKGTHCVFGMSIEIEERDVLICTCEPL